MDDWDYYLDWSFLDPNPLYQEPPSDEADSEAETETDAEAEAEAEPETEVEIVVCVLRTVRETYLFRNSVTVFFLPLFYFFTLLSL